ncbi:MAG: PepSY-associated TM helix domain-containing protein [Pseudomonas sp.]|uniref:PepSY-associated TM helix domain-containing protein n=1 Tax=Pseudomonas sp. TaxID=306 RepID=UPI00273694D2|nr:PepSY-associated TM helix domain-containing protein [Pseudomonas sp.]MDP3846054.1 PepSY-associated TM helix domain-containing protein [Pseudomonas sp.]
MFTSLRQAMLWLHSVLGLGCAGLLFVAFFMGSLALYDSELDRWMLPQTRLPEAAAELSLDRQVRPLVEPLIAGRALEQWYVELPSSRVPLLRLQTWDLQGEGHSWFIDPGTGQLLAPAGSQGGDFFYRFHYRLHLNAGNLGLLLVGLASMVGLLVISAGLLIHVRLFKDFFSFRPHQSPRRLLDLHNLSGVFALPFFLVMLLSGLLVSFPLYLPAGILAAYQEQAGEFEHEARATFSRPAAGQAGSLASLDAMAAQARRHWQGGEPAFVRVWHPGDARAYVEIGRSLAQRLSLDAEALYFDGPSGQLLHQAGLKPAAATFSLLAGLHVAHFQQPLLRLLYFLGGVSGCLMLASGLLYWNAKRRLRLPQGRAGLCLMEALTASLVGGLPLATLAMLVANRLLPESLAQRADWEVWLFFGTWLSATLHSCFAVYRSDEHRAPWRAQCAAIALLALAAALLNWTSSGDHPLRTLTEGQGAVAGVDAALLLTALLATWAWTRQRRAQAAVLAFEVLEDA